jgi:hypothetical protein
MGANFESGGRGFESLRARQYFNHFGSPHGSNIKIETVFKNGEIQNASRLIAVDLSSFSRASELESITVWSEAPGTTRQSQPNGFCEA